MGATSIRNLTSIVLLLLITGACANASVVPSKIVQAKASHPAAPVRFDFHVGFWMNLHQRLYAESGPRPPSDRLQASSLDDQRSWERALELYRARYPERGFLTLIDNDELVRVNRRLAELERASDLSASDLPGELRATLETVAPGYRRQQWPTDERLANQFRDRLAALLARSGEPLARALERAYETPWPETPVRVDVAAFAGPTGAYSLTDPMLVTFASHDERHAGDAALEILFHEASHGLVDKIERSIARACAARGKPVPPSLWHEVLFYSTGEVVRRQLGAGYTPYGYKNGLYSRSPDWAAAEPLLAEHWPEYLDGKTSLDRAIDRIVDGLP